MLSRTLFVFDRLLSMSCFYGMVDIYYNRKLGKRMTRTRETDRSELYKGIEAIADDLRGSVDGWDFKQYVLGFLFYRYISERLRDDINKKEIEGGAEETFDYKDLSDEAVELEPEDDEEISDKEDIVDTYGFFIKPSHLFHNVVERASETDDLNVELREIFDSIIESSIGTPSEDNLKGLFDDIDTNSTKLGGTVAERNKRLVDILNGINSINFGDYGDRKIDLFGDAYEHLMAMYAKNAGRSGGEYFTPQEVSELLTKLSLNGRTKVNKVYDPTCGSGSLLLQSAKILGVDGVEDGYFGQELNYTTYNLCRINMFLHNIGYDKFTIAHGDTLKNHLLKSKEPFDVIVSNPPYSIKWDSDDDPTLKNDSRYTPAGVLAPKGKADLAFVMHILSVLSEKGIASVVSFPGVLYRGGREKTIREYLVKNSFVDAIIELPSDLFYGTSISTCIMVLRKDKTDDKVTFIDASADFVKVTNANKLSDKNIADILAYYQNGEDVDHKVRRVGKDEIEKHDYDLSVSTYVEKEDLREIIDIDELNNQINSVVGRIDTLRDEINAIVGEING